MLSTIYSKFCPKTLANNGAIPLKAKFKNMRLKSQI